MYIMLDPKLLNDPNFNPMKTANREPPADQRMRRHCPVRLLIPTQETNSPVPTWTDVAFAYVRELAKTDLAPQIRVMSGDMGGVDLLKMSRWFIYRDMFYGLCPQPGPNVYKDGSFVATAGKTFVNVVIGAGDLTENLWTVGAVNILITGYAIPPYKVGWLPERAWDYDYIVAPSQKHADKLDELRRKAIGAGTCSALRGAVPVVTPRDKVPYLVETLNAALAKCVPESERVYL